MTAVGRRVSTGQTVRALAEGWATAEVKRRREQAEQQQLQRKASVTFGAFAGVDFFTYDGRWALDRRPSGKRLSPRQCQEKRQTFNKHVLPVLGEVRLNQVNRSLLKDFRNGMFCAGYSGSTINRASDCICAVLEAAEDVEPIAAVPRLDRAAARSVERGILSAEELRRVFMAHAKFRDETGVCTTAIPTGGVRGDDARSMHLADSLIETVCEIQIA